MKAYEAAKKLNIPTKDFIETHGLKSHLSKLSEDLENSLFSKPVEADPIEVDQVEEPAKEPEKVKIVVVEKQPALDDIRLGIIGAGNKSKYWKWRHLLDAQK